MLTALTAASIVVRPIVAAGTEELGGRIWREGAGRLGPVQARLGDAGTPLRGPVACAGCHGSHAEGGREQSLAAPALRFADGPAAAERALSQALEQGVGTDGRRLSRAMPRYRLEPEELGALADFLLHQVQARVPGVMDDVVRIGLYLPAPLHEAYGEAVRAGLAARQGGVFYGRVPVLVPIAADEDPSVAAQRLEAADVLALVASLEPPQGVDLPVIGPLGPSLGGRPDKRLHPVRPTLADQARSLVAAAARLGARTVALAVGDDPAGQDMRAGATDAALALGLSLVDHGEGALVPADTALLVGLPPAQTRALLSTPSVSAASGPVLITDELAGSALADLDRAVLARVVIAAGIAGADGQGPLSHAAHAGTMLAAALSKAGRKLDRTELGHAVALPTKASRVMRWNAVANALMTTTIYPPHSSRRAISPRVDGEEQQ